MLPAGVRIGHFTDPRGLTGCTVVLFDAPTVASVDVRGGAPGTTETDLLDPVRTAPGVHAVLLTGGSAFGLAAADGVMRYLDERGVGFPIGPVRVPLVAGAVVFDLLVGDPKAHPDAAAGYAACEAAGRAPAEGSVGAGTGATVAKLRGREGARRGGLGLASVRAGTATVTAIAVVNAVGGIWDDERNEWVAELPAGEGAALMGANTTLACVVTDARLTKSQCYRVAAVAHDGLARAIRPAHTDLDGDTIFCVSVGGDERAALEPALVQIAAADAVSRAIVRGVRLAAS
jgi:L-aminopeptidase/D-esterase-like protein